MLTVKNKMTASVVTACQRGQKMQMESRDDDLRTVECLRGRLLAERQASRVAKEEAELMGNKLIELENKLKEETKLGKMAEKKLKLLMKKLQSLKISPTLEGLELSSSSENSAISCTSSLTSISGPKDPEESESKSLSVGSTDSPLEVNSSTQDTCDSHLDKSSHGHIPISQDSKACDQSSEVTGLKTEKTNAIDVDNEDSGDNSLALVTVAPPLPETSTIRAIEVETFHDKSVSEVLDALRLVREKIQNSIGTRHMIRVGPA